MKNKPKPKPKVQFRVRFVIDTDSSFEECNGEGRPLTEEEYAENGYMRPDGTPIPYAEYLTYSSTVRRPTSGTVRITNRATEALARYARHLQRSDPPTAEDRWNEAALDYLLRTMNPGDRPAYYAGVARLREAPG